MAELLSRETGTPNPAETLTIRSSILDQDRRIYIQLPGDYERTKHAYPLLVVLDGEWLFEPARAQVRFLSEHQAIGLEIPKMIVVGIENLDRDSDYVPTTDSADKPTFPTAGQADRFLQFLRDELLPLLEREYRIAVSRAVVGWSFGGLCALYSSITWPDLFDAYLCIGPALWWDDELVMKQFAAAQFDHPTRMVITLGALEADGWVYDSTKKFLAQIEQQPKDNLSITYLEFEGVGHTLGIPPALNQGLRALFPGYRPLVEGDGFSLEELQSMYASLSRAWGFDVEPSASVVLLSMQYRLNAEQPTEALRIAEWYLKRNATHSLIHHYKGMALSKLKRQGEALDAYRAALVTEQAMAVPDGVYTRGIAARIAACEASMNCAERNT